MKKEELDELKAIGGMIERAITLVDRFVPVTDRNPTPGGGEVRVNAVALLVAARAMVEAAVEREGKNP